MTYYNNGVTIMKYYKTLEINDINSFNYKNITINIH